jgi:hypothetical protein
MKSLNRLKQTPKQWHEKFNKMMLSNAYLTNGTGKYIASFIIMKVPLFVYIY